MTKIVMTGSFRGGTGKSTVLSNLANFVASVGLKAVIIDSDITSPGVHAIFGLDKSNFSTTFTDYLINGADVLDAVYDISNTVELPDESLFLVPSSIARGDIMTLVESGSDPEKLNKAVERLSEKLEPDFIFIDSHPGINPEYLVATDFVDIFLNIVRPDNQDYQGAEITSQISKKMGLKSYIVLNKVHKKLDSKKLMKRVEKAFKVPVAGALPFSDKLLMDEKSLLLTIEDNFSLEIQQIAKTALGVEPRGHLDIMYDLLHAVKEGGEVAAESLAGAARTHPSRFKLYIDQLKSQGFLIAGKSGVLKLGRKGSEFLKKKRTINKFVKNFGL